MSSSISTAAISRASASSLVGIEFAIVRISPFSSVNELRRFSAKQIGSNVAKELPVPFASTLPSLSTLVNKGAPPVSLSRKPDSGNTVLRHAMFAAAAASLLKVNSVLLLVPLPPGTLAYSSLETRKPPFNPTINSESGI